MKKHIVQSAVIAIAILLPSLAHAQSWSAPTTTPPGGNIASPVNTGTTAQVKNGGLSVNAFTAFSNAYFATNAAIGTTTMTAAQLLVAGVPSSSIRISGTASGGPARQSILYLTSPSNENRARGIITDGVTNVPWFFGSPYSADAFTIGRHATQPEYPANTFFYITSAGNVGIGTSTPSTNLTIAGNTYMSGSLGVGIASPSSAIHVAAAAPTLRLQDTGAGGIQHTLGAAGGVLTLASDVGNGAAGSRAITFNLFSTEYARLATNGYFGIGTTSPLTALAVTGQITTTGGIRFSDGTTQTSAASAGQWTTSGSDIYNNNAGNVGVGISAPVQKFQVQGALGSPASSGTAQSGITRVSNSTDNVVLDTGIRASGIGAWLQVGDKTALGTNYPLLLNPNGGYAGVGTSNLSLGYHFTVGNGTVPQTLSRIYGAYGDLYMGSTNNSSYGGQNPAALVMNYGSYPFVVGHGGAYPLILATNNAERVRIDSSGNVGIGNTNPTQGKLVVGDGTGDTRVIGNPNNTYAFKALGGGSGGFHFGATNATQPDGIFSNNGGTERMRITDAGNVGIGTTTPAAKLSVTGSGTGTGKAFAIANSSNVEKVTVLDNGSVGIGIASPTDALRVLGSISFGTTVSGNRAIISHDSLSSGSLTYNNLDSGSQIWQNAAVEYMRLTAAGNLGIGTTTPNQKLSVIGNVLFGNSSDTTVFGAIGYNLFAENGYSLYTIGSGPLTFGTASQRRMTITSAGNVGIATTSPLTALAVTGQITTTGGIRFNDGTQQTTAAAGQWVTSGSDIYNANSGNVGIGATSPLAKLDISHANGIDAIRFSNQSAAVKGYLSEKSNGEIILSNNVNISDTLDNAAKSAWKVSLSGNDSLDAFTLQAMTAGAGSWGSQRTVFKVNNAGTLNGPYTMSIGQSAPPTDALINAGTNNGAFSTAFHGAVVSNGGVGAILDVSNGANNTVNDIVVLNRQVNGGTAPAVGMGAALKFNVDAGSAGAHVAESAGSIASFITATNGVNNSTAMTFSTDNSGSFAERMRLNNLGYLGIGTTSPLTALAVTGQITTTGGIRFSDGTTQTTAASGSGYTGGGAARIPYTNGSNVLTDNANFLFKTGAGSAAIPRLEINDTFVGDKSLAVGFNALNAQTTAGGGNTAFGYSAMALTTGGVANAAFGFSAMAANTTGLANTGLGYYALNVNTTGQNNTGVGAYALRLNTTGSVNTSLGQISLGSNTSGGDNTAVGYSALGANTTGSGNTALGRDAGGSPSTGTNSTYLGYNTGGSNGLTNATAIGYNTQVTASNSLILGNGAKVGIGNTAPSALLTVGTNIGIAGNAISLSNGTGAAAYTYTGPDSTHNLAVGWDPSGAGMVTTFSHSNPLYIEGSQVWINALAGGGNVGVGTVTPGYKLEVNGSVGAASFFYTSDKSLKKNIKTLDSALDKVTKLRGVSFDWKKDSKPSVGLIAQEVEKVYPELVSTNPQSGLKSVEYGNLVGPLIEAIKEQQKQIDTLKAEVEVLKQNK